MADNEALARQQPKAEIVKVEAEKLAKPAKPAKPAKKPKEKDGVILPLLVEFIFTFSAIFVILVFLTVALVSWLTGTTLPDFILRVSVAVIVEGCLLLLFSRQVWTGVFNASLDELKKPESSAQPEKNEDHGTPEAQ